MTETRVFLDRDLRRISSYEVARSFPLPLSVALSADSLPLRFDSVSAFYGVSAFPFASYASSIILDLSIQRSLRSVSYDQRLAHASGLSDDGPVIVDLRPRDSNLPEGHDHPDSPPIRRACGGTPRPRSAATQVVGGRGSIKAGAEGSADGTASAAGGPRPPFQSDSCAVGFSEAVD